MLDKIIKKANQRHLQGEKLSPLKNFKQTKYHQQIINNLPNKNQTTQQ